MSSEPRPEDRSPSEPPSGELDVLGSALQELTLPELLPDDAMIAKLQRSLAQHGAGPRAGDVLAGRYRLEVPVGRGGMGVVWQAQDVELQRRVAIKMLSGVADPLGLARMRREARAVAQLAHPNVAAIYDVVIDTEPAFIAMEYVEGGDLGTWLERQPPPPWADVVAAFEQAGHGLAAAHRVGLVHRDFKPANVIVGHGRVRVVDFGLARVGPPPSTQDDRSDGLQRVDELTVTRTGTTLGTPAYMAPEQHGGGTVTAAADVFAFACSLYEALYGARPFRGTSTHALAAAKLSGLPTSPPEGVVASRVPAWLYPIVVRGLAADPAQRWPSMEQFVGALRRARRRRPAAWVVVGALAAAATLWFGAGTSGDACREQIDAFGDEWARSSANTQRAVAEAGVDPALHDAVVQGLGDFGARWTTSAADACVAREHDPGADVVLECLSGLRDGAGEQLERAAASPAAARRFARELDMFVAIDECSPGAQDGLAALPADPEVRREIAVLRAWTDDRAAVEVDPDLASKLRRAEATGHPPTLARVHLAIAWAHEARGDAAGVAIACESGFAAATAGGSDWLALQTVMMCISASSNLGRVEDALRWNGHIDALSERLATTPVRHRRGQALLASALARAGELDEARRLAAEIDRETREGPAWSRSVLDAIAEIGMIAIWLDEYALAVERLERGYAWARQYHGDEHDVITRFEGRLATAYRYVKRYADAERLFERTLARSLEPAQALMTRLNYAQMLADQPARLADADAMLRPVYTALVAEGRGATLDAAHVLAAMGQVHLDARRLDDAKRALDEAKVLYARHLPPAHIHAQNVDQLLARVAAASAMP